MAPAIVHFLVGASLCLLIVAPFVLRYDLNRSGVIWLVPLGGLWGLLPDIHHIAPIVRSELRAVHSSPLVDLFAFHYTLDTPTIRGLYIESVFGSILLFLVALAMFSIAQSIFDRTVAATSPHAQALVVVVATVVSSGYAATAWGLVVRMTNEFGTLATLAGGEGMGRGFALVVGLSMLGGVALATIMEAGLPTRYATQPHAGALAGGILGFGGGIVSVAVVAPIWLRVAYGTTTAVPLLYWPGIVGLLIFGLVFGTMFATIRGAFSEFEAEPPASTSENFRL